MQLNMKIIKVCNNNVYWTIADKDDTARAQLQHKKKRKIIIIIIEDIQGLLRLGSVKVTIYFQSV